MSKQVRIKKDEIPKGWSMESADCINRLIQRKASNRLGFRGATELKEHSWFKYYAWKDLYLGRIGSPFMPKDGDNFDEKYCNKPDQTGINTKERYLKIKESFNYKIAFNDFYYFNREEQEKQVYNNIENCKNPHIVYFEGHGGEINDNDASIINRNILSNKSTDDEIYQEIKKIPRNASFILHKLYGKNNNSNFLNDNSFHLNKKNNMNDESNMYNTFKNSFHKKSKASGFGY